jgi:hypothetical protein
LWKPNLAEVGFGARQYFWNGPKAAFSKTIATSRFGIQDETAQLALLRSSRTPGMALITGWTAVHIPAFGWVTESGRVIAPMANGALEGRVGRAGSANGIRMADGADTARSIIAMIDRK